MTVSITSNLTQIDSCDANTGWSDGTAYSGFQREGSACLGDQISTSASYFTKTISSTNVSNSIIYIWMKLASPETQANGGYRFVLGDGTNQRGYYVGGSDAEAFSRQGWFRFILDTSNPPTSYDQIAGSSEPNFSAITLIGVGGLQATKAVGNSPNFFWDSIDYVANDTYALLIGGGTSGDPGVFSEIVAEDASTTNGWGIVRELQAGVYGAQGALRFGDAGTSDSYFEDKDAVLVFENPVVPITDTYYVFDLVGNSTGTNSFVLGNKVGSGDTAVGSNGCTIQSAGPGVLVKLDATNFNTINIYGCKFYKIANGITLSSSSSHEFIGNTVDQCGIVSLAQPIIRNCVFSGTTHLTTSGSAVLWNDNVNIKNCSFNANTNTSLHAIQHPASGVFDYDGLTFIGNDYDIYNYVVPSGNITVNALNGANPGTWDTIGGWVDIINAVLITITLEDAAGNPVPSGRVGVYRQSDNAALMLEYATAAGIAQESYNYTGDTNIYVRVRKSSPGSTRYLPYLTTGTITSAGYTLSAVLIEDTVAQ